MMNYLLHVKPHKSRNTRGFELYNEGTILSVTYLFMMSMDLVTDDELRFTIGWAIVSLIGLCIILNLANVIFNLSKKIKAKIKDWLERRRKAA